MPSSNHQACRYLDSTPDNLLLQKLLSKVRDYGGRFLEKDDKGNWHETNENRARKKVSQGKSSRKAGLHLSIDHTKVLLIVLSTQHFERPAERSFSWRSDRYPKMKERFLLRPDFIDVDVVNY